LFTSFLCVKVGGGEDIFATIRWSQKLLYDNGQFSVEVPFRFPQYVNPLPKVFMKKEKIQLTVNSGVSKEVLLQGTSHPLKVIKYLLFFLCNISLPLNPLLWFQEKSRQGEKLSFLHEAVVENWSAKDFTFTYTVSYPMPSLSHLYLFDIFIYACSILPFYFILSVEMRMHSFAQLFFLWSCL
jgi:hypothetical protein